MSGQKLSTTSYSGWWLSGGIPTPLKKYESQMEVNYSQYMEK